jgi:cytochrome c peroxidase
MKTKILIVTTILMALAFFSTLAVQGKKTSTLEPIEQLGKEIFFDKISSPGSMSCADCHDPSVGWTGPIAGINQHGAVYRGAVPQRFGDRKPPASAYSAFAPVFHYDEDEGEFFGGNFWDGRATGERLGSPAAEQALGPFLNPVEQNMPSMEAVCSHIARARYSRLFIQVWGPGSLDCSPAGIAQTYDRIGLSIAAYELSAEVNPFSSKFDAYLLSCLAAGNELEACGLAEGDKMVLDPEGILTEMEFDGLIEFGEYCADCHVSHQYGPNGEMPLLTDFSFHNIGVPKNPKNPFYKMDKVYLSDGTPINPAGAAYIDLGLGAFLRTHPEYAHLADVSDGKFKTPSLRNIDMRPAAAFPKAFMHNGSLKTLHEVVDFYNTRDLPEANWPPPEFPYNLNDELFEGLPIGDFQLEDDDVEAVVAFLKTLTDGYIR